MFLNVFVLVLECFLILFGLELFLKKCVFPWFLNVLEIYLVFICS